MNQHKLTMIMLVAGLLVGLHLAFRSLAHDLPTLFPHIAQERAQQSAALNVEIQQPLEEILQDTEEPEEIHVAEVPSRPSPRIAKHLVSSTRLPTEIRARFQTGNESFEVPPALEPIVDFWRKIYGVYTTHQVVFHDAEHLELQYSVLDFTDLDTSSLSDNEKSARKQEKISEEMDRLRSLLRDPQAAERLRTQTGLKDRFREGLQRSARYMPHFEKIFASYGLPPKMSRLAFVESLFIERAYSKVGAAGVWQFMPGTAARYMSVNKWVDERYDPIVATHAAARLLLRNYDILGTWPLAINAYNSGTGNLLKAISQLGTHDIATIITQFRRGSYAFASRNFYPCFLAAVSVYENQERYFGRIAKDPPLEFDLVEAPSTMTLADVARLSDSSLEYLRELNPGFRPEVFSADYAIPAGSQIRIPAGQQPFFAARYVNQASSPKETSLARQELSRNPL